MQTIEYKDEFGNIFMADINGGCFLITKKDDISGMI